MFHVFAWIVHSFREFFAERTKMCHHGTFIRCSSGLLISRCRSLWGENTMLRIEITIREYDSTMRKLGITIR
ncbi:hypothetical protein DPMN_054029 [Dreissena polymorpha]|uniref:Uncharacterized protein n=1 Tax=Dreissena polymorpha TaxID=45954 RepID=A0A9D4HPD2_DREPO|nr:hypothetical protein DPMN_054029 [Dreissena polymorpha]